MHRRNVLLGSLGCLLPSSIPVHAQTKPSDGDRLKDFPALRGYLASLKKIPGGAFQMGGMNIASEKPVHTVTLSAFRMAATPVTVAVWKEYCKATSTPLPKEPSWGFIDDHPVIYVSWNDIMGTDGKGGFCAWASDVAGFKLMLPTEAQFEYASLGGKPRTEFPWGDTFDLSKVWCSDKSFGDAQKTAPVSRTNNVFRNAYGLTDISGNVYQWCSDLFMPYGPDALTDPNVVTSDTAKLRCARGGCLNINDPVDFRCSDRSRFRPDLRVDFVSFRLAAGQDCLISYGKQFTRYPALKAYVESLCPIPAGTFQMGCASGYIIEKPVHSVTLSAFRMGATPVTVAIWKEFCAATGTKLPEAPAWGFLEDHPVVNVSWNDIMGTDGNGGFCAWASDVAGFRLTLPTEAQFEYAARGGQSGLAYPWGDTFDATNVWCSGTDVGDAGKTAPVIRSSNIYRNAYGLTDMAGNVYQWCTDLYAPYSAAAQTDPTGPKSTPSNGHCLRGGTWKYNNPGYFRCTSRDRGGADVAINIYGFRLVAGGGEVSTNVDC